MFHTSQCQKPRPVGASGSKSVSPKLLVPVGGSFQVIAGETLPPLQPTISSPIYLLAHFPSLRDWLDISNARAGARLARKATAARPLRRLDIADLPFPATRSHCP